MRKTEAVDCEAPRNRRIPLAPAVRLAFGVLGPCMLLICVLVVGDSPSAALLLGGLAIACCVGAYTGVDHWASDRHRTGRLTRATRGPITSPPHSEFDTSASSLQRGRNPR